MKLFSVCAGDEGGGKKEEGRGRRDEGGRTREEGRGQALVIEPGPRACFLSTPSSFTNLVFTIDC